MVFNYALISLSIIKNGTFDINILRILRRQILQTKDIKNTIKCRVFDYKKKDMSVTYLPGCYNISVYEYCMGLVCCGLGFSKINCKNSLNTIKVLISAFFYRENNHLMFSYFEMFKLLLIRYLEKDERFIKGFLDSLSKVEKKEKSERIMKKLKNYILEASDLDKKFIVDVLSDYYENHHFKNFDDCLIDLKVFSEMICSSK